MAVKACNATLVELPVSGRWVMDYVVTDDDGCRVDATTVVTVTPPSGVSAPVTPEDIGLGRYRAVYDTTASEGRYVASVVATGYGAADFVAYVSASTIGTGMPTVAELVDYLGLDDDADGSVEFALTTEAAAQRDICRVEAVYSPALRGALFRRVARNLALKGLPIMVLRGDGEIGDTVLPGNDPEVRRLERPHRKVFLR